MYTTLTGYNVYFVDKYLFDDQIGSRPDGIENTVMDG